MLDASVGEYFPGFGYKCVHHGNESLCWVLVPHKQHSVANSTSVYSKVRHGANIRLVEYWISGKICGRISGRICVHNGNDRNERL